MLKAFFFSSESSSLFLFFPCDALNPPWSWRGRGHLKWLIFLLMLFSNCLSMPRFFCLLINFMFFSSFFSIFFLLGFIVFLFFFWFFWVATYLDNFFIFFYKFSNCNRVSSTFSISRASSLMVLHITSLYVFIFHFFIPTHSYIYFYILFSLFVINYYFN